MRFTEISLLALSAATVVSGHKQYHKSTLKTSPLLVRDQPKTLHKGLATNHPLMARQGSAGDSDYCSGVGATCESCFGPGYIECSDGYTCYDPSDSTTSCDDSTGSSGSDGSGSDGSDSDGSDGSDGSSSGSDGSGSGSGGGDTDYCYGKSCSSCFGPGYIECSDGTSCYDPSDSSTYCPSDGTSSGSDGSDSGSETTTSPSIPTSTSGLGSIGDLPSATTSSASSSVETSSSGSTSGDSGSGSSGSSSSSGDSGSSGDSSSDDTHDNIAPGMSIPMGLSVGLGGAVLAAIAVM
ncbi:hypothetical protein PISL3812_03373 [Talaromyces islandicus]|uniref:GPI anchored protein n=1 Tax=Talaromyces islandicus TaxID=28573 RepID=A0A0U1LSJ4_TALIS|nr:hypothetical protein PISL3812_03373 [Talaromyces islandicus]